jgi:hypothetical protein
MLIVLGWIRNNLLEVRQPKSILEAKSNSHFIGTGGIAKVERHQLSAGTGTYFRKSLSSIE